MTTILAYHPPEANESFPSELSELLSIAVPLSPRLMLLGDMNIHTDSDSKLAYDFIAVLDCFNITQHVHFPTHIKEHILDLVCSVVLNLTVFPPPCSHCLTTRS